MASCLRAVWPRGHGSCADPTGFVVENATAMIWRLLLVAKKHFRKIAAPQRATAADRGVVCEGGVNPRS